MQDRLDALWYGEHAASQALAWSLVPGEWLFRLAAGVRRGLYRQGLLPARRLDVPVVVVGNIAVGGAGKTPLVLWLARFLRAQGYRPGIVCRGYAGRGRRWPQRVEAESDPVALGDEAVLLARRAGVAVAAAPRRPAAAALLVSESGCDVVVSDDGLQHYALSRDVEIAVVDGVRRYGNGRCLPAGPLREPTSRLAQVDLVVCNGQAHEGEYRMRLIPADPRRVGDDSGAASLAQLRGAEVHAVCGIGHPARFFRLLAELGLRVRPHRFPDHHRYRPEDLRFADGLPVLMTEKDAVKCRPFAAGHHWYLPIDAELPREFGERVLHLLRARRDGQEAA